MEVNVLVRLSIAVTEHLGQKQLRKGLFPRTHNSLSRITVHNRGSRGRSPNRAGTWSRSCCRGHRGALCTLAQPAFLQTPGPSTHGCRHPQCSWSLSHQALTEIKTVPQGFPTVQSGGGIFSTEGHYSRITLACFKLTLKTSQHRN